MDNMNCSLEKICDPLSKRCQAVKAGGVKGFITKQGRIAYSTGRADKGKSLSFCPFCGFDFRTSLEKKMEQEKDNARFT